MKPLNGEDLDREKVAIPDEDAWAYTRENRGSIERALRDGDEGRVRELTEADLDRLTGGNR